MDSLTGQPSVPMVIFLKLDLVAFPDVAPTAFLVVTCKKLRHPRIALKTHHNPGLYTTLHLGDLSDRLSDTSAVRFLQGAAPELYRDRIPSSIAQSQDLCRRCSGIFIL